MRLNAHETHAMILVREPWATHMTLDGQRHQSAV